MVTLKHPNGCIHDVRDDLVAKFLAAGWEKAVPCEQPIPEEKPKRKRKKVEC